MSDLAEPTMTREVANMWAHIIDGEVRQENGDWVVYRNVKGDPHFAQSSKECFELAFLLNLEKYHNRTGPF